MTDDLDQEISRAALLQPFLPIRAPTTLYERQVPLTTTLTTKHGLLLVALAFLPIACDTKAKPTPENYIKTLNTYFNERSECLLPDTRFPFETSNATDIKRMDTLVASQLLTVTHETAIHVSRYVPTTLGEKSAPHFCYGHRNVTAIDSFTPLAPANGFNETQVTYHYAMKDVPVWAKTPAVQEVFPDMAAKVAGSPTDKATLAQTRVGFQVPD